MTTLCYPMLIGGRQPSGRQAESTVREDTDMTYAGIAVTDADSLMAAADNLDELADHTGTVVYLVPAGDDGDPEPPPRRPRPSPRSSPCSAAWPAATPAGWSNRPPSSSARPSKATARFARRTSISRPVAS